MKPLHHIGRRYQTPVDTSCILGREYIFKGMEDPERIKSISGISDIVMEEATEFTLDDYSQLQLRLRNKSAGNNQVFIMYNPASKDNWVYHMFHKVV